MKVSLISYTPEAERLLIFTKLTRLSMTPELIEEIRAFDAARVMQELTYMAGTIPSSWEFVDYVFLVNGVSRAYTHQQVRTRAASYAQQTMRILDMGTFDYVFTKRNQENPEAMGIINGTIQHIQSAYKALRELGQAPEDARGILPTNIATNIVCKFNLRTLAELARSRTGGRTQDEYIQVINAMLDEVIKVHPWAELFLFPKGRQLFDEIEALAGELPAEMKPRLLKIVDKIRKELV